MDEPIRLSPKEFALFEALVRSSGQVVTQRQLMIAGWSSPNVDGQYLRSYIALLREKLEADSSDPELIQTEPGVGYRLNVSMRPMQ
jgi:two-component system KDP operon response regulator KdpE